VAARDALDALHEVVGTLRRENEHRDIASMIAEFRAAGVEVARRDQGQPVPLRGGAAHVAYRVVEEGLTNAARHAPGAPVTVTLTWEPDTLLLAVTNPVAGQGDYRSGYGLTGLAERTHTAGGLLDHRVTAGRFRLSCMLPAGPPVAVTSRRPLAVGLAMAVLMFIVLPAGMLLGVGG
jgi:signal transduction histidine kinase